MAYSAYCQHANFLSAFSLGYKPYYGFFAHVVSFSQVCSILLIERDAQVFSFVLSLLLYAQIFEWGYILG